MEKITVFFVADHVKKRTRQLTIYKSVITLGICIFLISFLCSLFTLYNFSHYIYNRVNYTRAALKNNRLHGELSFVKKMTKQVEQDIQKIFHFDDRIRILYGLNIVDKDIREVGVGGPDFSNSENIVVTIFDDRLNKEVKDQKVMLEKLIRQAEFESGSINETYKKVVQTKKKLRRFPAVLPSFGRITSGFGYRVHPIEGRPMYHQGIDIANKRWTPVYATADGVVKYMDYSTGFGNLLIIEHGYGYDTFYGHLQDFTVKKGQFVMRNELIGYLGNSGRTTGPHLHYEIRRHGKAEDPLEFIYPVSAVIN